MSAVTLPVRWSILGAAPDLAVFAGVLAGLVFLGLVEYTKAGDLSSPSPSVGIDRRLSLMLAAFFSFIVAAFLFSVVHGDDPSIVKASFAQSLCPCVVLAVGVVQLVVSVALGAQSPHQARQAANSVAYGTIAIAVVFLAGIAVSPFFQGQAANLFGIPIGRDRSLSDTLLWIGSILLVGAPIGATFVLGARPSLLGTGARSVRITPDWLSELVKRQWIQIQLAVVLDVAAAVMLNVLTGPDNSFVYGSWQGQIGVAAALLITGVFIAVVSLELSVSAAPRQTTAQPPVLAKRR